MNPKKVLLPQTSRLVWTFIALLVLASFASVAEAQVLNISGVSAVAAATDHTALGGEIAISSVSAGLLSVGTIKIDFGGVPISNLGIDGISTFGADVASIDHARGILTLSVLPDYSIVTLSGVRFNIAASGATSVTATFSAPEGSPYSFVAGNTAIKVIGAVRPGLKVAPDSDSVIVIEPGAFRTATGQITILEGYAGAFASDLFLGQTVATEVKIVVQDLPEGVTIRFPERVDSPENGSTLTVPPGTQLTLPTTTGETTISYVYAASPLSALDPEVIESFPLTYLVEVGVQPTQTAFISMQATFFMNDPANIPYYDVQYVPAEDDLPFPEYEIPFPVVMAPNQFMGVAFTNTSDRDQTITLTLLDRNGNTLSGTDITNPVAWTVPQGTQKRVSSIDVIFGSGILNANLGTMVAKAKRTRPVSFFLTGNIQNTTLDGVTIARAPLSRFVLPYVIREGPSPYTALRIFNPSTDTVAKLSVVVRNASSDILITSPEVSIGPRATLANQLSAIMNADLSQITGGYVEVTSSQSVFAFEVFGNDSELNIINAQDYSAQQYCWIPHFAVGGGYETELDLINLGASGTVKTKITAFDDAGNLISGTGTVPVNFDPLKQKTLNVASFLGINTSQLTVGSILVEVEPQAVGPFGVLPNIAGAVRFKSVGTGFSAALPLKLSAQTSTTYAHVAQASGYFTGLAVFNPQSSGVTVTVEVFSETGNQVGHSHPISLGPNGRISKLLSEMVPASQGQQGGYFRVTSTAGVVSLALFGDGVQSLAAIPAP